MRRVEGLQGRIPETAQTRNHKNHQVPKMLLWFGFGTLADESCKLQTY